MIIYKITNKITGKIYIGQFSNKNKKFENYYGSGKYIKRAVNKYGKENFTKEILCECKTREELDEKEQFWIKKLNSINNKIGYNITSGGKGVGDIRKGHFHTKESKQKMSINQSISAKKRYSNPLNKIKARQVVIDNYIKHPEIRDKISNTLKILYQNKEIKRKRYDMPEYRNKISDSLKGQVPWNKGKTNIYSKETLKKMSDKLKGHQPPNKGKKFNKETKHYE